MRSATELPDNLLSQKSFEPSHSCTDMKANSSGQDPTVHLSQIDTDVSFKESKIIPLVRVDGHLKKGCSSWNRTDGLRHFQPSMQFDIAVSPLAQRQPPAGYWKA